MMCGEVISLIYTLSLKAQPCAVCVWSCDKAPSVAGDDFELFYYVCVFY